MGQGLLGIRQRARYDRSVGATVTLAVAVMTLSACAPAKLAEGRVRSALVDAGLSDANAACMADRMTDRLSIGQLQKLQAFARAQARPFRICRDCTPHR